MNILQITKYFYPAISFGGPVQCTYNLSKYLVKRGHEVTVYATDALNPNSNKRIKKKAQNIEGAEVYFFPYVAKWCEMFITPSMIPTLRDNIEKYDIIHLHEYRTFQNIAFLLSKAEKTSYILETHGINLPEYAILEERRPLVAARRLYDRTFGRKLLKKARKLIALTKFEEKQLIKVGVEKNRIVIIPNGIAPEDFCDFPDFPPSDFFRTLFGLTEEKIILYIGRINKRKKIDILLKAFSRLTKDLSDVKLIIAGADDGCLRSLKKMATHLNLRNKVLFTGPLTHKQKLAAYNDATVIVYPGIGEGFPIVPLEAGVMGKPIIVTNDPGMDFVKKGGYGLIFEYGNEVQLKQALDRILQNQRLEKNLGRLGKKYVLENFTWDTITKEIENVYLKILE